MQKCSFKHRVLFSLFLSGLLAVTANTQQSGTPPSKNQKPVAGGSPQPPSSASTSAEQPKPIPPDKVVLKVGEDKVTAGDLYDVMGVSAEESLRVGSQARKNLGDQYALMLVLANKAVNDHVDSTPEFARQLARQRTQLLGTMEYKNLTETIKVTPEDVSRYYSSHKDEYEEIEMRRAYVRKKTEGGKADTPGLSPQDAKARAEAISKEWATGKDVKDIEKQSGDPKAVFFDKNSERALIKQLPEEFKRAVLKLKPGEVSEPIESVQGFSVLQLLKRDYVDENVVSLQIENQLRKEKVDAAMDVLKSKTNIWMDDEYFNYNPPQLAPGGAPKPPSASPSSDHN